MQAKFILFSIADKGAFRYNKLKWGERHFRARNYRFFQEMLPLKNTKMLVLILLIIGFVAGLLTFWDVLTSFLVAALFAYLLNPMTNYIVGHARLKRGVAVAIVFLLFIIILTFIVSVTAPSLISQLSDLLGELRRYASDLDAIMETITGYMEQLHIPAQVVDTISSLISQSDTYILSFVGSILTSAVSLSMQIFDLIVFVILLIYFMLDGPALLHAFVNILPESARDRVWSILREADDLTWKYLKSRCVVSGGMGIVTFIGLKIMGIKYALLFAIISFVLDFIPYFGSFIACVIEVFYALLTGSFSLALTVLIFVLVVQQIEGNIIAPKVQGDAAGIHPITVMFALLACNRIWGTLGMLISTPVAAIVKLIIREMYDYVISPDLPAAPAAAAEADAAPPESGGQAM